MRIQTAIWSIKRKVWMKGPESRNLQSRLFPSVINSTTIVIIGEIPFGQEKFSNFLCVDVPTNTWTHYPSFPNDFMTPTALASTVSFDKNGKRYDEMILKSLEILCMLFYNTYHFQNIGDLCTNWLVSEY